MKEILKRWHDAYKLQGNESEIITASGQSLKGCYMVCECGAFTPSHDPLRGFSPSVGFPCDDNGQSVNDRDYLRDMAAQEITRTIAQDYDGRAIQSPVIVSPDGVVLSGNGRTMAGILAAHDGTDSKYIAYLQKAAGNYGIMADDLKRFSHPRIVFVLSEILPYTASTFALFNAQEMKSQSKTEEAVKMGKLVHDDIFGRIIAVMAGYETAAAMYADTKVVCQIMNDLQDAGIINSMQRASLFDGGSISSHGKDFLENILIGKAFAAMPDAIRQLTGIKNMRRNVICALCEAVLSVSLINGYDLKNELALAVNLAYQARQAGYKDGEKVSIFARQRTMFGDCATVADYDNKAVLLLADAINDKKENYLRKVLAVYNKEAKEDAAGQMSMFAASVRSKDDIMAEVVALFAEKAAEEQKQALEEALLSKKADSINIVKAPLKAGNYAQVDLGGGTIAVGMITKKMTGGFFIDFGGSRPAYFAKSRVSGTYEKRAILPAWLAVGNAIRHGDLIQIIDDITEDQIVLRWINGGYFDIDINMAVMSWQAA